MDIKASRINLFSNKEKYEFLGHDFIHASYVQGADYPLILTHCLHNYQSCYQFWTMVFETKSKIIVQLNEEEIKYIGKEKMEYGTIKVKGRMNALTSNTEVKKTFWNYLERMEVRNLKKDIPWIPFYKYKVYLRKGLDRQF
ncbi:unnamed protein product [Meloidogyne enterolobii]|uniref:Uncharacterized protein n=4 Tax=Meloidogyne enterolobii TaxID=390850 RepID=A0ACB1A1B2_MELEN|nr:unnamed protein product [Meloidogyne enterolobii]